EPQVALDQLALRVLVAEVLAARQLPLLGGREQRAGAELTDVELERVAALQALLVGELRALEVVVGHGAVARLLEVVEELEGTLGVGIALRLGRGHLRSGIGRPRPPLSRTAGVPI